MTTAVGAVLAVASREVGTHEQGGNNCGARVEEYLGAVGLGRGNPWCAAFVAWCMRQAGASGWPMTGDTWGLDAWARRQGVLEASPQAGDVFLLLDSMGKPMHTGFVESVQGSSIRTIEGNTGMQSDADGDGVARKSRPVGACHYVRWAKVLSVKSAAPALRVALATSAADRQGATVDCHPVIEDGTTRVDLRAVAEALGTELELHLDDGLILVHPKQ